MKIKVFIFLIVFQGICGCKSSRDISEVHLINKSTNIIISGTLKICGQNFKIADLNPEEEICFSYETCSEDSYFVNIEFANGRKLSNNIGYITYMGGVVFNDYLIITNDEIIFKKRELKNSQGEIIESSPEFPGRESEVKLKQEKLE